MANSFCFSNDMGLEKTVSMRESFKATRWEIDNVQKEELTEFMKQEDKYFEKIRNNKRKIIK